MRVGLVSLRLFLDVSFGREAKGGGSVSDDWAKKAADAVKAASGQRMIKDAKSLQDGKLREVWAPKKWAELRHLLHAKVDSFNAEAGNLLLWESIKSKEAIVRIAVSEACLVCTYHEDEQSVEVVCSGTVRKYIVRVINEEVVLTMMDNRIPISLEEIAEELLDLLLAVLRSYS